MTIVLLSAGAVTAGDNIQFIGMARFSGSACDHSGQPEQLINGVPHNRLGGFSALEYSGVDQRYVALPDRGPDDGATGYLCRFQILDININLNDSPPVTARVIDSIPLTDAGNRPFTGDASAFAASSKIGERLDSEGFRFAKDGGFYLSDEVRAAVAGV